MKEILLTSSALILALLALRQLFRRTVSRRMQYALWLLVLVRLLVPVNVGTLAHNVLSAAEPVQAVVEERLDTPVLYVQDGTERRPAQLLPGKESQGEPLSPPSGAAQTAPADEYYTVTPTYRTVTLSEALTYVWSAGMAGVGAWFLFTNLRFARALRKARTPYSVEGCRYPVYLVSALPSPCLFGVLRPAVYLNEKALQSPDTLRFVLAHEQTHARLAKQFFDHTIQRRYVALVWGNFDEDEGTITGNIGRSPKDRQKMFVFADGSDGKHAVTHWKVLKRYGYVTLVECRLETGRTHQIRVHMAWIGHPLFNDERYGGDRILKGTTFAKYRQFIENCFAVMPRHALHARLLGFEHPATHENVLFESPLPADFQSLLTKWNIYTSAAKETKEN